MATALQLVNKVLRRLREDEVTTFTNSYTNLILDFVNETKREVEDSWNWTSLRTTKTITTVTGTRQYSLTGAGCRFRVLDVWDTTSMGRLVLANVQYVNDSIEEQGDQGSPYAYRVYGQDSYGDPYIDITPVPEGGYTITLYIHMPQADLSIDGLRDVVLRPEVACPDLNGGRREAAHQDDRNLGRGRIALEPAALFEPGVAVIHADAYAFLNNVAATPGDYGMVNVQYPYLLLGAGTDLATWLFWDDYHPTTRGHEVFADEVMVTLLGAYSPRNPKGGAAPVQSLRGLVIGTPNGR